MVGARPAGNRHGRMSATLSTSRDAAKRGASIFDPAIITPAIGASTAVKANVCGHAVALVLSATAAA